MWWLCTRWLARERRGRFLDVFRVDLASGRREWCKKIGPTDLAGAVMSPNGSFTPDGKHYACGYSRVLSELYTLDGLC